MAAPWDRAWSEALDRLEEDVTLAEALLADGHRLRDLPSRDPWRPPAGLGPLPIDLRPRADAVLDRQLQVSARLAHAMVNTAKQVAMLERVGGRPGRRPAYVDCAM
jgi:hypothetical protein